MSGIVKLFIGGLILEFGIESAKVVSKTIRNCANVKNARTNRGKRVTDNKDRIVIDAEVISETYDD